MGKRNDLNKILLIGSGPIVIGQACEFDYSGSQACKALKAEGYEVVLVNSNPATIMTDRSLADKTYIEPLTVGILEKIIDKERPDAILPTLGGQTALNLAIDLFEEGVLNKYNVEMIGADAAVIEKAENRDQFKTAMQRIGVSVPLSGIAHTIEEARLIVEKVNYPAIIRPAFTMGGTGGGIAYNVEEFEAICVKGLDDSPVTEVLIEQSIIGWKEFELEVMRDRVDNVLIVCSIENMDPMGVHTGDSITVAPIQTLTDREYQNMREVAKKIIREIGVETGGSNIQFAVNPENGDLVVIEMNPRVSRSSALASKATGFPIAKLAAKLAVGYTLDELKNDITRVTPASFEPALDYCVVKIPRFHFEKFPQAERVLGISMKSVGEVMAIGRTFREAFQKALRSLELKRFGFGFDGKDAPVSLSKAELSSLLRVPSPDRLGYLFDALSVGFSIEELYELTKIDPWFLYHLNDLFQYVNSIEDTPDSIKQAKQYGFSDVQLASILSYKDELSFRSHRQSLGILPTYKIVDTCAGEFEAHTPYYYSTYEDENEYEDSGKEKVMILGSGPNRIGQGIEFDYCCVHAAYAAHDMGYESIMVNSNPETVSTDFDTSDKLYFEPLTFEDVMNIYEQEKPKGVIVQFGGQTPLNIAKQLQDYGVTILGTSYDSIDLAEDRKRFQKMILKLGLRQPENGTVTTLDDALLMAKKIGYPVLVRPSYVLGGASMEIIYDDADLSRYMSNTTEVSQDRPILIDQYLENAIEVDVDALSDGKECVIAGIMEHIEEAGIHSGDSACVLPPHSIPLEIQDAIRQSTYKVAKELQVVGLLNIQFAVKNGELYMLEVNPRGSRTVPFVSKTTGIHWAKLATKIILGETIQSLGIQEVSMSYKAVKEAVFPFKRFPGIDMLLGPEMKSTGEVMGIDPDFGTAYIKSQIASGQVIPLTGSVFVSVKDRDKERLQPIAQRLDQIGFKLLATSGTARKIREWGIQCDELKKVYEGRPHVVDYMKNGEVQLVINTPSGKNPHFDEMKIRQQAYSLNIPVITTISGAMASLEAIAKCREKEMSVCAIQEYSSVAV